MSIFMTLLDCAFLLAVLVFAFMLFMRAYEQTKVNDEWSNDALIGGMFAAGFLILVIITRFA